MADQAGLTLGEIIEQLKLAALRGYSLIISGERVYRHHLMDAEFNEIVPPEKEDKVLDLMYASQDWWRREHGFNWRELL